MENCCYCKVEIGTKGRSAFMLNKIEGTVLCDLCALRVLDLYVRPDGKDKNTFSILEMQKIFDKANNLNQWYKWAKQLEEEQNGNKEKKD